MSDKALNEQSATRKTATVFGGSGFVGQHIVAALSAAGWKIRVAVRNPRRAESLKKSYPAVETIKSNITSYEEVLQAIKGADAVINCVGILAKNGAQNFYNIHIEGAGLIAKASHDAGVKHLVHISAIGAHHNGPALYAKTKALGEQAVLAHFPTAVILRPSIVFGAEDSFFNRFAAMTQLSPFLPAIGGGGMTFQPVYVDDVAGAVMAALSDKARAGTIYELGGPEILSFKELLQRVGTYTSRGAIPLSMPFWFAKCLAIVTKPLPIGIRPITYDQVLLLDKDNVVSPAAQNEQRTLQSLGITQPRRIDEIVPAYLSRFGKN